MSIKKRLPPEDDSPIMRRFVQVTSIIATFAISAIFSKGRRCALPPSTIRPPRMVSLRAPIAAPFRSVQVWTISAQLHFPALPAETDLASAGFRHAPAVTGRTHPASCLQDLVPQLPLSGYLSMLSHSLPLQICKAHPKPRSGPPAEIARFLVDRDDCAIWQPDRCLIVAKRCHCEPLSRALPNI